MRRLGTVAALIAGLATAVSAAMSTALPVSGAFAATAQQTIAELNAQRSANGIPAGITENPTWSADCQAHDHYMATNGVLTHTEDPNAPAYTDGGAYAGKNAVLSEGGRWDTGNPYEYAPLHLDQLLAPRLLTLGSADAEGFSCTTTFPGWSRPDPPAMTIYTYPGNGASIYPSEVAKELPWTPGDLVGLPQPSRTGPTLFVFVEAPGESSADNAATLSSVALSGPSGPVDARAVDGNTALPAGSAYPSLAPYISSGGFIIPARPLISGTSYHAHVVVTFGGVQKPYDWSFTTRGADPNSSLTAAHGRLLFTSRSHQQIVVTFTSTTGGGHSPAVTIAPHRSVRLKLAPGTWQACGHQPAAGGFSGYDQCVSVTVTGSPALRLGKPKLAGSQVRMSLSYSAVLRGRSASETLTPLTSRCTPAGCKTLSGRSSTSRIRLRARSLALPLPAPGHGFEIDLRTSAFTLRGAPWNAAHAVVIFIRR